MTEVFAALILALLPANWVAAILLRHAFNLHPDVSALKDRAQAAGLITLALTFLIGPLALAVFFPPVLPFIRGSSLILIGLFVIIVSGVNVLWLVRYYRGTFGGRDQNG